MRHSPLRVITLTAALAAACTPALGAVGDLTPFPTLAPGGGFPQGPTVGPDGATWFFATYATDPGTASRSQRATTRKRATGVTPTSSRLIRVGLDGSVSSRGATPFRTAVISGLTTFAGDLWVLSADVPGTGPYRATRYATTGAHTAFGMSAVGYEPIAGPDGNLWFWKVGGDIGRMTNDGVPLASLAVGATTVLAPGDGVAWTAVNPPALRRVGPDGSTTDFATPSLPQSIASSSDGFVWYVGPGSNAIGRMGPGGNVAETSDVSRSPSGVAVSPDGIAWVTDGNAGVLYRVTQSLSVQTLTVPDALATASPIIGSDGNLWLQYMRGPAQYQFARVLTGVVPVNVSAPVATGKVASGQVLNTGDGQWRYAPTGYSYQWQRCDGDDPRTCTNVPGSTAATHQVTAADLGKGMRVSLVATNLNGTSGSIASNILTNSSPPAATASVGKPRRKGYVISTRVTVTGPGRIAQVGTVTLARTAAKSELAKKRKPKVIRACAPKPITLGAAGARTIRCVLSPRVKTLLAAGRRTVTLKTTFTPSGTAGTTITRRIAVPRIPKRR